jgi:small subunit ribosomal protein S16
MVVIRLARRGAKKRPFYHIVVADKRSPRDGKNLDILGYFNPIAAGAEKRVMMELDKINMWISKGAQLSDRVKKLVSDFKKDNSDNVAA